MGSQLQIQSMSKKSPVRPIRLRGRHLEPAPPPEEVEQKIGTRWKTAEGRVYIILYWAKNLGFWATPVNAESKYMRRDDPDIVLFGRWTPSVTPKSAPNAQEYRCYGYNTNKEGALIYSDDEPARLFTFGETVFDNLANAEKWLRSAHDFFSVSPHRKGEEPGSVKKIRKGRYGTPQFSIIHGTWDAHLVIEPRRPKI